MASVNQKIIGLIAGNGKFPFLWARAARESGYKTIAAAVWGDTLPWLYFYVDRLRYFKVGELKNLFDYFRFFHVREVIMAGQVNPDNLFNPAVRLDEEFKELSDALANRKADTIFSGVAQRLHKEGMRLLDSTLLLKRYLAPRGTLTKRAPTECELEDIEFGFSISKQMGGLDVGQTVVVKEKAIVAIEAMEGTDRAILRGGKIARCCAVVVKASKPKQDVRFDVPVIGPRTIEAMRNVRASCLAIEADKTLIIDREKTVALADKAGICVVAKG